MPYWRRLLKTLLYRVGEETIAAVVRGDAEINALKGRLQKNDKDVEALVRLANLYQDAAMWEQAADYYGRAIELREDPDLITDLGTCFRGLRQFDRAIDSFARASALAGDHWQSRFNFAIVSGFDLGQYDAALAAVDWLEALDPTPPNVAELRHALERARNQPAAGDSPGQS